MQLDSKIPSGPIDKKWEKHKFDLKLVNPANRRKYTVIIVGTGLAGGSAAASLGEMGYNVLSFCFQDSARRAHSIAAQGGINAAKNYPNDGDSIYRLAYDTIKGGEYRSRESNVYRLAENSVKIIDHCVALGVPFAREYGGLLSNRSFGGAQLQRTFYARGQTGQQLLLGAYSAMMRQVDAGRVKTFTRHEMLDLVVVDGRARGIVTRDLVSGKIESFVADAVVLATGGYGNLYFLATYAKGCNVTAIWRAYKKGALMANPCYTQIHPTCIPVTGDYQSKLTLMSESLRNDGRVWAPKKKGDNRSPNEIPDAERDYYLERKYPAFGNLAPRDIASRAAKEACDEGRGVGPGGRGVYLDFRDAILRYGRTATGGGNASQEDVVAKGVEKVKSLYGNLFAMYEEITHENAYKQPMRIYPAVHYTMGGLWVDYNLMSNLPGLFVLGEANFSDHGANRLGASALMQGLSDGFFIISSTLGGYLADVEDQKKKNKVMMENWKIDTNHAAFKDAERAVDAKLKKMLAIKGKRSVDSFHRELGLAMWEKCGMARNEKGLKELLTQIPAIREDFWKNCSVTGGNEEFNQALERAGRVADFLEFGELLVLDALERRESCGGHFREEYQITEGPEQGECKPDHQNFAHVACWEYKGEGAAPVRNVEPLVFEEFHPKLRSYK